MEYFDIPLKDELWQDFIILKNQSETFKDYKNYFKSLVNWVKSHKSHIECIHNRLLVINQLDTILEIKIEDYLTEGSGISLEMEAKRMFGRHPETLNSLLMRIGNTLWDLVRYNADKECPNCMDRELEYMLVEIIKTKKRKIILDCDLCGYSENLNGSKYTDGLATIHPVNERILLNHGVTRI